MQKNSKFMRFLRAVADYVKVAKIELIVIVAAVAVDLISKAIVDATMDLYDSVTLIPKFLHITYIHNYAAAFGSTFGLDKILGEQGVIIFFIVVSFLAVGFFGYLMYRNRGKSLVTRISFALIIGGAIGNNLIDRLVYGYVRDFIQFQYFGLTIFGSQYFAIFNFADAALCIGVAMFAVYYIFIYKEPKKEELAEKEAASSLNGESDTDKSLNAEENATNPEVLPSAEEAISIEKTVGKQDLNLNSESTDKKVSDDTDGTITDKTLQKNEHDKKD